MAATEKKWVAFYFDIEISANYLSQKNKVHTEIPLHTYQNG